MKLKNGEKIDHIYSDQIQIIQDKEAFSFSLDTILLAAGCLDYIKDRDQIVEFCAGNCAASIYLAHRSEAHFKTIEIQEHAYDQGKRSIELNHLENRVEPFLGDVNDAVKFVGRQNNMVLVNPPYFKVAPGHVVNPNEKKAIARHEILVDLEHIILQASQVLKNKGRLVMVHRPERLGEICYFCQKYNLPVKKIQPYSSSAEKESNLLVITASKNGASDGLILKSPIITQTSDGHYNPEINQYLLAQEADVKKNYYFYVLLCNDNTLYGGFTTDLQQRLNAHNSGKGAKYTKSRRPVKMIYHECFNDKQQALKREYWFKHHSRSWKEQFLKDHNVTI